MPQTALIDYQEIFLYTQLKFLSYYCMLCPHVFCLKVNLPFECLYFSDISIHLACFSRVFA